MIAKINKATTLKEMAEIQIANAPFIGGYKYLELPLELLVVDMDYQRKRNGECRKLMRNFDPRLCDAVLVSYRDGNLNVIDGQGRINALILRGDRTAACKIIEGLTHEEEASIFASQGNGVVALTGYDRFNAALVAKDPVAIGIKELADEFRINIVHPYPYTVGCIKAYHEVRRVVEAHGIECLRWIFSVIEEAGWHNAPGAYGGLMISTLRNIYTTTDVSRLDMMKHDLSKILRNTSLAQIRAEAVSSFNGEGVTRAVTVWLSAEVRKTAKIAAVA